MEQVEELRTFEGESVNFTVEELFYAAKDVLTCETQSLNDEEIILQITQLPDAVDADNDEEKIDFVMTPPSKSEVVYVLKVLQSTCLYHDVGEEMRKNMNSFE